MYVKKLKLANFKSFKGENNVFEFSPHINYLVGNNNAGKSTVIEALEFMSSPRADGESYKNTQCEGQPCYVELTLAGNDIEVQLDKSNVTAAQIKTIKNRNCIIPEQNEDRIVIHRDLDSNEYKKIKFLCKNKDTGEFSFENITGIDKVFTAFFTPIIFHATDTPDDVLSFGTRKILGTLIGAKTKGLASSPEWERFLQSYDDVFSSTGRYSEMLEDLNQSLSEYTREQFPSVTVSFAFDKPETSSFIKMGKTRVDDGVETDLDQKGTGLQRAVAFAALREYARTINNNAQEDSKAGIDNLFLCVDEPEIWMHPKAQKQLAKTLATISETNQVWISTHSPYILQGAFTPSDQDTEDPVNLLVFSDDHDAPNRVQESTNFGKIHPGTPSLAEITYEAFQIPTIEYCMELFGLLCIYKNQMNTRNGSTGSLNLDLIDNILKSPSFGLPEEYKICKKRFNSRAHKKNGWKNPITNEILPLYVRNINDHPESISEKTHAIDYFLENDNKYLNGDPIPPEELRELERIDNTCTEEDLGKAIEILLWAIPRCRELMQEERWTWDFSTNDIVNNLDSLTDDSAAESK